MSVLDTIKAEYSQMTKSEKNISAYLLSHREECEMLSISELAKINKVSSTTLIRFARKLGFEGFREFKQELSASLLAESTLVSKFQNIACNSKDKLLSDTINHAGLCLEDTFSKISQKELSKTLNLLSTAPRVYTFGMKESFALAHYAYTRLYTVRENVFLFNLGNGDLEPLLDIKKDDVFLGFLFHRYTHQTVEFLEKLKNLGALVVLVTNPPLDSIEKYAQVLLPCTVNGLGIKNTSVAPICLMDYLCNALATNESSKTLERLKNIESLLETSLDS